MKPSHTKAFTIVETLVAIVLIAFTFVTFFSALMTSFNHLRRVMELRTASLVLQEQVSLVRELPFASIQSLGGTFTSGSMSALTDAAGTIMKAPYDGHDKIIRITFTLDWTDFVGNPASKTLVTLMTERGINKK